MSPYPWTWLEKIRPVRRDGPKDWGKLDEVLLGGPGPQIQLEKIQPRLD